MLYRGLDINDNSVYGNMKCHLLHVEEEQDWENVEPLCP